VDSLVLPQKNAKGSKKKAKKDLVAKEHISVPSVQKTGAKLFTGYPQAFLLELL